MREGDPVTLQALADATEVLELHGDTTAVRGLAYDSRKVQPGDLFFCVPGASTDGHLHAAAALEQGAAALVVQRRLDLPVPYLRVDSVRQAMGPMSAAFWDWPSRSLVTVGVTGTNGKTTVCAMLESILNTAGWRCEVMGTLTGVRTTPEAVDLQQRLACWRTKETRAVAMEVSSHALHQHRVDGTRFDVVVFTNLGNDHLDYHGSTEAYFAAKARLFTPELADQAVVNAADEYGSELIREARIPTTAYDPAKVGIVPVSEGQAFTWQGRDMWIPQAGRFNVANALAAAEAARLLGVPEAAVATGLERVPSVPGRFERIQQEQAFEVIVDYAHTPEGLHEVLSAAAELTGPGGQVRVVFGCGGDRDPQKRPLMGAVAAQLAGQVVVTSDNPRSEDPMAIIQQVLQGAREIAERSGASVCVEPDRRTAIHRALSEAADVDVVIIAGKGHETTQETSAGTLPFDDRAVARELLTHRSRTR